MTYIVEAVEKGLKDILDEPITLRKLGKVALGTTGVVALGEAERIGKPYVGDLWRYVKGEDGDGWHDVDLWTNIANNRGRDWVYSRDESALLNQKEYFNYWADRLEIDRVNDGRLSDCYIAIRNLSQENTWYYDWHKGDSGLNEYDWWREQGYRINPDWSFPYQNLPAEIQPEAQAVHEACRPTSFVDEAKNVWNYDRGNHERLEEAFGANAATFAEWAKHFGSMFMWGLGVLAIMKTIDITLQASTPWINRIGVDVWQKSFEQTEGWRKPVRAVVDLALALGAFGLIGEVIR